MAEKIKHIDISPHRSILTKISQTGYSIQEALSELIDNSIDARIENEPLKVSVNITKESITVSDNGTGMTEEQASRSIRLGYIKSQNQIIVLTLSTMAWLTTIEDVITVIRADFAY